MSKTSYLDIMKLWETCEGKQPPEHLTGFLNSMQSVINRAYQDGYNNGIKANQANLYVESEAIVV